jgi:hypothetical protein
MHNSKVIDTNKEDTMRHLRIIMFYQLFVKFWKNGLKIQMVIFYRRLSSE